MGKASSGILLMLAATLALQPAVAAQHGGKKVLDLHVDDYRECVMFRLEGVSEADPVKPGQPWFVLSKSHPRFAEAYGLLVAARVGNVPVNIVTTGAAVTGCDGYAGVKIVGI